jgi:hypothetical protein
LIAAVVQCVRLGVVDRKDVNERIDGFGKWSTYIYTLRMAGDMRPYSFLSGVPYLACEWSHHRQTGSRYHVIAMI